MTENDGSEKSQSGQSVEIAVTNERFREKAAAKTILLYRRALSYVSPRNIATAVTILPAIVTAAEGNYQTAGWFAGAVIAERVGSTAGGILARKIKTHIATRRNDQSPE